MKPTVFVQTNHRQRIGAKIAAHSFQARSRRADDFDVRIIDFEDFGPLTRRGQSIVRGGHIRDWDPDDLQSFTPLRFAPPTLTGFAGRALVTDPDCFAVSDVAELLFDHDMAGKAVAAVPRPGHNGDPDYIATSVMLLDCAQLRHWDFGPLIERLFAHDFDYVEWMQLKYEERSTIGALDRRWNDFDRLGPDTGILHTTKRRTQPWKTGLPVDYTVRERGIFDLFRRKAQRYQQHPDRRQEAYVYALLAEMIDRGTMTKDELVEEMAADHIRHDSLALIERYRGWELGEQAA